MFMKKVTWEQSDLLIGDLMVVVEELESIKDDYVGLELVVGKGSTIVINILDSRLDFNFTEESVFVSCELKHENSFKLFYSFEQALNLLKQHIELYNTYMKLLCENL